MFKKIMAYIKIPLIVVGIIFVFLIITNVRSCYNERRGDEIARLEGLVSGLEAEVSAQKEKMGEEIGKRDEENKALEAERVKLSKESSVIKDKIKKKDNEIAKLKAEFEGLDSLQDRHNNILKQNISLSEDLALEREDKNKIQKSLDNALKEAGNERSSKLRALEVVDKQAALIANLKKVNEKIISNDKRIKLESKISKTILIPLAIFGGYKLIQNFRRD